MQPIEQKTLDFIAEIDRVDDSDDCPPPLKLIPV
jgi:hypothetical protein